ncbi:MAG: hypothetical protein Q9185_002419 [Variospora sp. 1 TL-2023]
MAMEPSDATSKEACHNLHPRPWQFVCWHIPTILLFVHADSAACSAVLGSVVRIPLMHNLEIADAPWSSVSPGLWLNVEIAIGIVSGSLPLMRPLFTHPLASQFLSRFSKSHVTTGSHRLPNGQQQSKRVSSSQSKGLHSSGIYAGASQQQDQKNWYDNSVSIKALGSRPVGTGIEEEAEDEVVPMGKIQVKHDLEWEQMPSSDGRS